MCQHKSFYDRVISPRVVHCGCSADEFSQMRERIVPRAIGVVVEIGIGSGLNLPHYDPCKVERLIGIEPDLTMLEFAEAALAAMPFPAELHRAVAERLPLKDAIADTIVVTYALCTIANPAKALAEIKRVLKPNGTLLFCEHARANGFRASLQATMNGVWGKLFGGCSLTRDPVAALTAAGFDMAGVLTKPFPLAQMLLGTHVCGEAHVRKVAQMEEPRRPTESDRTLLPV